MRIKFEVCVGFIIVSDIMFQVGALQCWKCIAHDCDADPATNYRASKVNCKHGDKCMKVRYKMFDNVTHYDSIIRTCTDSPCTTSSLEEFFNCVATPKLYMIGGCILRSCCNDRDLCNSGRNDHVTIYSLYLYTITFILTVIFYRSYKNNNTNKYPLPSG